MTMDTLAQMGPPLLNRLLAWLCVVALGLNAAAVGRALVHCRDAAGSIRLEWGCAKDAAGHCAAACTTSALEGDGPSAHSDSESCDDAPVATQPAATARVRAEPGVKVLVPAPAFAVAATLRPPIAPRHCRAACTHTVIGSPPLEALRTVVLLV